MENFTKEQQSSRIKEERKRLKLTQKDIAEKCGIKRLQWGRYERAEQGMSTKVLAQFGKLGADTSYILTGIHSTPEEMQDLAIGFRSKYYKNGEEQDIDLLNVSAALNQTVNRDRREKELAEFRNNLFESAMQTTDIDRLNLARMVLHMDNDDFNVVKSVGYRLNKPS